MRSRRRAYRSFIPRNQVRAELLEEVRVYRAAASASLVCGDLEDAERFNRKAKELEEALRMGRY